MKTVTFSTLYPSCVHPRHGIFIEQRLRHLLETGVVESHVVAPVPWFPSPAPLFGHYSEFARVPYYEERHGIPVYHPRYPLLPKIGLSSAPLMMAEAVKPVIQGMIERGFDFDLIDAHYIYPDGVSAAILGRHFRKPVVMSVLGDDVITYPKYPIPRWLLLWAVKQAGGRTSDIARQHVEDVLLVDEGRFCEAELRALLGSGRWPARNSDQNIGDLAAQIAACRRGAQGLEAACREHGRDVVKAYMGHVHANAEEAVGRLERRLGPLAQTIEECADIVTRTLRLRAGRRGRSAR